MTEWADPHLDVSEVVCRRMTEDDLPQVMILGSSTENFQVGKDSGFWPERIVRRWLKTSEDPLLVAELDEQVIGFIFGAFHSPTRKMTLENIIVDSTQRRRGVAGMLLDNFVTHSQQLGAEYICALSKTSNLPTIKFFLKNGFSQGEDFAWIYKNSRS